MLLQNRQQQGKTILVDALRQPLRVTGTAIRYERLDFDE